MARKKTAESKVGYTSPGAGAGTSTGTGSGAGAGAGVPEITPDIAKTIEKEVNALQFAPMVLTSASEIKKNPSNTGAIVGGVIAAAICIPPSPLVPFAPLIVPAGAFIGKQFDRGGRFGKWLDNRPGVRQPNGWGVKIDLPGNMYAPYGNNMLLEFGEWGEYKSHWNPNDQYNYVGFAAWVCDAQGNRLLRVAEGLKYISMQPGGSFIVQGNLYPENTTTTGGIEAKWIPNTDKTKNYREWSLLARTSNDPPAWIPFEGFVSKSQFDDLKKKISLNNPDASSKSGLNSLLIGAASLLLFR